MEQKIMQTDARNKLSNVQQELLKLYSTDLNEKDINELKLQLAQYYAHKTISQADQVWNDKGYTAKDMEKWLNE
jgi:hypothetical protein